MSANMKGSVGAPSTASDGSPTGDQVLTRGRSNSPSPARPTNRPPAPSGQLSGFVSPNGIGTAKWASGFQQALVSATQPRNPDQPTSSSSDPTFVAQDQEASLSTSPTSYSLSAPIVVKGQYRYSTDGVANRSTETPSPAPPAPQSLIITKTPTRSASETSAVGTAGSRSTAGPSGSPPRENSSEPAPWSSKRKGKKINSSSLPMAPPPSSIASVPMADGSAVMAEAISDRWPDALYHGWMRKRNKGKASTAKQRYLVVKINCIEYYADPSSEFPKGIINFEDIAVQFDETLRVIVKEKTWEFQAESERDMTRWHVVWRAVLSGLNK